MANHNYRGVIDRLKLSLLTTAALEIEAETLTRNAERKAELLRLATKYEQEQQTVVALDLRRQAEAIDLRQPLGGLTPPQTQPSGNGHRPSNPGSPTAAIPGTSTPAPEPAEPAAASK
jgi:hypothetical protein